MADMLIFRRTQERAKRLKDNAYRAHEAWQADDVELLAEYVAEMQVDAEAAAADLKDFAKAMAAEMA